MATKRAPKTRRGRPPIGSDDAAEYYQRQTGRSAIVDGAPAVLLGSIKEVEYHAAHAALVWMLRENEKGWKGKTSLKSAALWVRGTVGRLQALGALPGVEVLDTAAVAHFASSGNAVCSCRADALAVVRALGLPVSSAASDAEVVAALRRRALPRRSGDSASLVFGLLVAATLRRSGVPATPSRLALVAGACGVMRFTKLKRAADQWERWLHRQAERTDLSAEMDRVADAIARIGAHDLRALLP